MTTIKSEVAKYFNNKDGIVAVYLFGSHAANSPRPYSDVDIGIIAEHADIDVIKRMLNKYIVDLGRILRKDVHPVILNIGNESLMAQVFKKGICLVVNNKRAFSEFRMHRLLRIIEFGYYNDKMQKGFVQRMLGD